MKLKFRVSRLQINMLRRSSEVLLLLSATVLGAVYLRQTSIGFLEIAAIITISMILSCVLASIADYAEGVK